MTCRRDSAFLGVPGGMMEEHDHSPAGVRKRAIHEFVEEVGSGDDGALRQLEAMDTLQPDRIGIKPGKHAGEIRATTVGFFFRVGGKAKRQNQQERKREREINKKESK